MKRMPTYCFVRINSKEKNLITASAKADNFFVSGFTNQRKAFEKEKCFDKHKFSDTHRKAKDLYADVSNSTTGQAHDFL